MKLGDSELPLSLIILSAALVIALIFSKLLFYLNHNNYSIKYSIMKDREFFRTNHGMTFFVEIVYKVFFSLPIALLIIISIIRGISNALQFLPILINGGIVLLILYPTKQSFYYAKEICLWILAVASQFITIFLFFDTAQSDFYTLLSSIFYPINCILFCLAMLAKQKNYWQIQNAVKLCEQQVGKIHLEWTQYQEKQVDVIDNNTDIKYRKKQQKKLKKLRKYKNISYLFDGGIYGNLCKNYKDWKFRILYFLSLCMLGLNAFIVWKTDSSNLGLIGLITNFIYDLFILSFNNIQTKESSIRNIFLLIFLGRFLSFVFGKQLWIFGYCALYFIIGIFIGKIIINQRLPLKLDTKAKKQAVLFDAFKTPQFVIFILTVEVIGLVIASSYGIVTNAVVNYGTTVIPLWQFAMIVVIATWIVILYMASIRMIERHNSNIKSLVQYYFVFSYIQEHHVYIFVTYLFIVGLGVYGYQILNSSIIFFSCIFLPLILEIINKMYQQWKKNQYQILASIDYYNKKIRKMQLSIDKKKKALENRKKKVNDKTNSFSLVKNTQSEIENTRMALVRKSSHGDQKGSEQFSQDFFEDQIENLQEEKKNLTQLVDWRSFDGVMTIKQIWQNLTPSDHWLLGLIPTLAALLIGFTICSWIVSNSYFGLFISISFISYLSLAPYLKLMKCLGQFNSFEFLYIFFGIAIGIVAWSFLNERIQYALIWASIYILLLASLITAGTGKIDKKYIILLITEIAVLIIFICIFLGFKIPLIAAIVVIWFILLVCIATIPAVFHNLNGQIPKIVIVICAVIIIGSLIAMAILGFLLDIASNFAVFSFICVSVFLILFITATALFYIREANKFVAPHVYSSFGQPIYKFDSMTETLKPSIAHKFCFDFAMITIIIYAAVVTIIFDSKDYAIYALGFYASLNFFLTIMFSLKSYHELAQEKENLTNEIITAALHDLTQKYMIDCHQNRFSAIVDKEKHQKIDQVEKIQDKKKLNEAWLEIVKLHEQFTKNEEEEIKFFYFWIALINFHLYSSKKKKMIDLINQTKEIESYLIEYGIFLESVNLALDFQTKYELLTKQIDSLNPYDYVSYEQVLKQHQEKMKKIRQAQQISSKKNNQVSEKRDNQMYEKLKEQMNKSGNQKIQEFSQLIKSLGKKGLYTDEEFPANENSLGDLCSIVESWRRPKIGEVLQKGGFSPYDVKQGLIGDCYLISSFGVLGEKWIRPAFGYGESEKKIWTNGKGAYMVRFYKFLKEVYVIVDDFLPINNQDEFVFAKSEDSSEIWPCILQKAYAKLYSGYFNIVQGKCHSVLAQFTGGFPFQILLEAYKVNPNGLWNRIINAIKNRYLLAAGSQMNPLGDTVASNRGIVQGHAYSVLDAIEVEDYKLIKLKNPHGSGGIQWKGDFSDESEFLTPTIMKQINHVKADDGIFWMKIQDFIHEYKSLYICCVFDENWFKVPAIEGQFTEANSFGTPNLSSDTFRNPQYGLTVTKKCTLFVNLVQESKSALEGVNYIYLRIQRNDGVRICKQNTCSNRLVGMAIRPTNTVSISNEVVLEAESYPYTFTLYVSCKNEGDTGKYTIEMYCDDFGLQVIHDKDFDREQF